MGNPMVDNRGKKAFNKTLPNDMNGIKTRLSQVLKTGNESDKDAPSLADEALPEYYNVIDACGKLGGSSADTTKPNYTIVDSLPNWKYPDFRDTKSCGANFVPYVGENQYLIQRQFKCGDPKIMLNTDCSSSGPSPPPTPDPSPAKWCAHPSDCASDEVCCQNCDCDKGDTYIGNFACAKGPNGHALPNSQQPDCCGGTDGEISWCAKKDTSSATNPQCSKPGPGGVPTPSGDFYKANTHSRCVKQILDVTCVCDNQSPTIENFTDPASV